MSEIEQNNLPYKYLVLDLNGTIACDGTLIRGVRERLLKLRSQYQIYILTADMHGTAKSISEEIGLELVIIENGDETNSKGAFIANLGPDDVISIGAGANDSNMLHNSALGIAVLGPEGLSISTLRASDIIASSITEAMDLLLIPERVIATLKT